MEDLNFRKGDAKTEVFGSNRMLQPSPATFLKLSEELSHLLRLYI